MNADGSNKPPLTNSPAAPYYQPAEISPDGSTVALNNQTGTLNSFEISTIGINGNNLRNITNNSVLDGFGAWSPDSAKIAFRSRRDVPTDEIYTMNADGSAVVRLTFNAASDSVTEWRRKSALRATPFDFDGDRRADVSVFRPSNGAWYLLNWASGFSVAQFGSATDQLTPADFDGDCKTDLAVYRDGVWFLQKSRDGFAAVSFGAAGDKPVPNVFVQ